MRRVQNFLLFGIGLFLLLPALAYGHGPRGGGAVSVRGYVKSDGTYVQPHMRSAPDGNFSNNWSTVGNVNPYTGAPGTKTQPSSGSGYVPADGNTSSSTAGYTGSVEGNNAARSDVVDGSSTERESSHERNVKVPLHAKLNYLRNGWVCERGYRQAGQECVAVQIPDNAKLNYLGNGWDCQRGYRQAGQGCVAVQIPENAKLNYLGNGWDCQRGYRQAGQGCIAVAMPENAKLNYLGTGWDCQRGYRQAGQECIAVQIPENAKLNYLGNGWECQRGYRQAGQACAAVQIPENGKLNYLGNG